MKRWIPLLLLTLLAAACSRPDRPNIELYLAVHRGDLDQVKRHLYWDTDINARDPDGRMPLHVAALRGHPVIVDLLLQNGARTDVKDAEGHTPLYVALQAGRTQIAEVLLKQGAAFYPNQMLLQMARAGVADRDVMDFLGRHGADPDTRGPEGWTPLTLAVAQRNRKLARFLIDHQADVNAPNADGARPLDLALDSGRDDIISLLRRHGALSTPVPAPDA